MLGMPMPNSLGRDAVGPLLAGIDKVWDERQEYGDRLRGRLEKLKPRSEATLQHVLDLLPEPSPRPLADGRQHPQQKGVRHATVEPAGSGGAADPAPTLSAAGS
jgi:hypothetical protein